MKEQPDVVFHMAAIHGAAGFSYEPVFAAMMAVNVIATQTILDYARTERPALKFVYANSAKIFPSPLQAVIDERTAIRPTCLYSLGKIAALELIRYYRQRHKVAASSLILFNHESPRRPKDYFLPTLATGLAEALRNPQHTFTVKTLDFYMDWSSAEELMDIAVDIAERAPDDDLVLASGNTCHAREMVHAWFARYGLDANKHVIESLPPQAAGGKFQVDLNHLYRRVGRKPERPIQLIVDELLQAARSR
jgi:GDPmannose 4,6-dehydratase